jgi:ribosomal protein S24E
MKAEREIFKMLENDLVARKELQVRGKHELRSRCPNFFPVTLPFI